MNSTPPSARCTTARVLGAVWPTYSATRSARVTSTRCPEVSTPSAAYSSAVKRAIVVLPVPGGPVNSMWRDGSMEGSPAASRAAQNAADVAS